MSTHNDSDAAIDELYEAWSDAFRRKDVQAILDLLTPDYVLWAPGAPPMTSADLAPRLEAVFRTYDVTLTFEREERIVSGPLAFERGWDVQHVQPRDGSEARTQRQRVFLVLQREDGGRWRFARGMSQQAPAAPAAPAV